MGVGCNQSGLAGNQRDRSCRLRTSEAEYPEQRKRECTSACKIEGVSERERQRERERLRERGRERERAKERERERETEREKLLAALANCLNSKIYSYQAYTLVLLLLPMIWIVT